MPVIHLEYDDSKLSDAEVLALSEGVRDIVSEVTAIEDVFVYANSARVKVQIAPIEIFVELSANKITDLDELMLEIKTRIQRWKTENNFLLPINLTLTPMQWKIEVDI